MSFLAPRSSLSVLPRRRGRTASDDISCMLAPRRRPGSPHRALPCTPRYVYMPPDTTRVVPINARTATYFFDNLSSHKGFAMAAKNSALTSTTSPSAPRDSLFFFSFFADFSPIESNRNKIVSSSWVESIVKKVQKNEEHAVFRAPRDTIRCVELNPLAWCTRTRPGRGWPRTLLNNPPSFCSTI